MKIMNRRQKNACGRDGIVETQPACPSGRNFASLPERVEQNRSQNRKYYAPRVFSILFEQSWPKIKHGSEAGFNLPNVKKEGVLGFMCCKYVATEMGNITHPKLIQNGMVKQRSVIQKPIFHNSSILPALPQHLSSIRLLFLQLKKFKD